MVNLAKRMASEYKEKSEFARLILADPDSLTAKSLYDRVRNNDPFALHVHEYGCSMLGKLIGMLLNTLAVDRVVLSGGLMASADLIIPEVAHHVPQWCWSDIWERCEIVAGTLGDTAGSLGSAAMALEEVG
jgi:predicted NBD/HSP70 family sugar kinase